MLALTVCVQLLNTNGFHLTHFSRAPITVGVLGTALSESSEMCIYCISAIGGGRRISDNKMRVHEGWTWTRRIENARPNSDIRRWHSACTYLPGRPAESFFTMALMVQRQQRAARGRKNVAWCLREQKFGVCSHNWHSHYFAMPLITRRLLALIHHVEGRPPPIFNARLFSPRRASSFTLHFFCFHRRIDNYTRAARWHTASRPQEGLKEAPPNTEINTHRELRRSALK